MTTPYRHRDVAAADDIAIIGLGCILPDACDVSTFWENVKNGKYSIGEVPPECWRIDEYYDPDPKVRNKTYCKLGAFVKGVSFDALSFRIPPKVAAAMDDVQKWTLLATAQALKDAGYFGNAPIKENTAVILGNALGGQLRLMTYLQMSFPEVERALRQVPEFTKLTAQTQQQFVSQMQQLFESQYPEVTADSMPGELSNLISGRIANIFDLRGTNYMTDAACASSFAALQSAIYGLRAGDFDMAVTGGVDKTMNLDCYVKFCKIGALSGRESCPFDIAADGFVMGEGTAIFVLKRLNDAERDGDKIYAVIRGIGSSSDGKGKGITAPNPRGQKDALTRAYRIAELSPDSISMIEAHGTSTIMGDLAEIEALKHLFAPFSLAPGSIAIGSVKSQIGHLKTAAGAAGLLKATLSLHHKLLPPSINCRTVNPKFQIDQTPLVVNTRLRNWDHYPQGGRRAGVSSFGFGGTNFHVVLEEYRQDSKGHRPKFSRSATETVSVAAVVPSSVENPLPQNILLIGAERKEDLEKRLQSYLDGKQDVPALPSPEDLHAPWRIAISFETREELKAKGGKLRQALLQGQDNIIAMLASRGIFLGQGAPGKVAFLFPGQGSQYLNMGRHLYQKYPIVAKIFDEADAVMSPRLDGRKLTDYVFIDSTTPEAIQQAERSLRFTKITQPAVLALDFALHRLLSQFAIQPDMLIGHSLGEYGALAASGIMSFSDTLIVASARAIEMSSLAFSDPGLMASVFAPFKIVQAVLAKIDGYVVPANQNSPNQTVIGGETQAVEQALRFLEEKGIKTVRLAVSHAFHTKIIAPAAQPLGRILETMNIRRPLLPIISNVTGDFYPQPEKDEDWRSQVVDLLVQQVASPVLFHKGIETLYQEGARIFIEVGPKKALSGLTDDILSKKPHLAIHANHPKKGELTSLNELLAALYAQGLGKTAAAAPIEIPVATATTTIETTPPRSKAPEVSRQPQLERKPVDIVSSQDRRYLELGKAVGNFIEQMQTFSGQAPQLLAEQAEQPVVISGISLGLPGQNRRLFDSNNFRDILAGANFIDSISEEDRQRMVGKNITRLIKPSDGDPTLEALSDPDQMVHLAGLTGEFDLEKEFAVNSTMVKGMARPVQMAVAAGILALRDAGIPLIMHYRQTSTGTLLPSHWSMPKELGDETGIIFASAFAGKDKLISEVSDCLHSQSRQETLRQLNELQRTIPQGNNDTTRRLQQWIEELKAIPAYQFDRAFLFKILPMGSTQLAEWVGARGPNTSVNSACASTSVAIGIAHDWIRAGRCRRVIVVAADDPTDDYLREWILSGFIALGAATTEKRVELAALPFDRRRHGMIVGAGAVGIVIEESQQMQKRGMNPLAELLIIDYFNSAFHPSRLDVHHICEVMQRFIARAESLYNIDRRQMANETMFMSHETYTPARGGSAAAEIESLRIAFGDASDQIVIANTKGFTGHAMAAGIEEVVAIKALQQQQVPPVANFKQADAELGTINLSHGGHYSIRYAIKFAAGFGSQIALSLYRRCDNAKTRITDSVSYRRWLHQISGVADPQLEIAGNTLRVASPHNIPGDKSSGKSVADPFAEERQPMSSSAPATPAQTTTSAAPILAASAIDELDAAVLNMVAEFTGYPIEMLATDLDIEADLGIDTIKQAEIFAALRDHFDLPISGDLQLRDYPTLKHLIDYIKENSVKLKRQDASAKTSTATVGASPVPGDVARQQVLRIVAEKTGYPVEMLESDLDIEADLGIDTVKQAEVFAQIRDEFELPIGENLQLRDYPTLQHLVDYVKQHGKKFQDIDSTPVNSALTATAFRPYPVAPPTDFAGAQILQIVSQITGYPVEMLEPDLDIEADLGIDTVKQAEVFAQIRDEFDLPMKENLQLRDYPTLQHLIGYVKQHSPKVEDVAMATGSDPIIAAPADALVSATDASGISGRILTIISQTTGYPVEMLESDLDIEADLGIDTVKQAEVFAQVRDEFNLPMSGDLQLRDYPTIQHIIDFIKETTPGIAPDIAGQAATTTTAPQAQADGKIIRSVPEIIPTSLSEKEQPRFSFSDNGVVLITVDQAKGVWNPLHKKLAKQGARVVLLTDGKNIIASDCPVHQVDFSDLEKVKLAADLIRQENGPVRGIIHLVALDQQPPLAEIDFTDWCRENARRVKSLFVLAQTLQSDLQEQAQVQGSFVVSATAMGGNFGFEDYQANTPIAGGVAGLTKSLGKELPEARVVVCDFPDKMPAREVAELMVQELLFGDGKTEVAFHQGQRHIVQVVPLPLQTEKQTNIHLGTASVFVITGGIQGITAEIAQDLAQHFNPHIVILDLVAIPENIEKLAAMSPAELEALKQKVRQELAEKHKRVTPVMLEKEFSRYTRAIVAHNTIHKLQSLGAKVDYKICDVTDSQAVKTIIAQIGEQYGKIDILIHGAGLEESKSLANKKLAMFNLVYDVKVNGAFNLVQAALPLGLKSVVFFSSVAGRFGNIGQTDYSAANDLLNKYAAWLDSHGQTKGIAINWTGWAGVGMATRETIKKIFEMSGVTLIPLQTGVPIVRQELLFCDDNAEVVIAGSLGLLDTQGQIVPSCQSRAAVQIQRRLEQNLDEFCLVQKVEDYYAERSLVLSRQLDPDHDLYLRDHAIEGTPLLPGVMGLEAFAQAGRLFYPDLDVIAIEAVQFFQSLKIFRDKPVTVRVRIEQMPTSEHCKRLKARLESDFIGPQGVKLGDTRIHFEGVVVMGKRSKDRPELANVSESSPVRQMKRQEIYDVLFHGSRFQVCDEIAIYDNKGARSIAHLGVEPLISDVTPVWTIQPLLIELGFQTAGLYEYLQTEKFGLPYTIDNIFCYCSPGKKIEEAQALVRHVSHEDMTFYIQIVSGKTLLLEIQGYKTISQIK